MIEQAGGQAHPGAACGVDLTTKQLAAGRCTVVDTSG